MIDLKKNIHFIVISIYSLEKGIVFLHRIDGDENNIENNIVFQPRKTVRKMT